MITEATLKGQDLDTAKKDSLKNQNIMRVLIADDHALVRAGVKQVLSESPDVIEIAEAVNGVEALKMIRESSWDVVLLDISMPGKNGLEVLKQIKSERPNLPVLVLSIQNEDQYALRVLKSGAAGYLNKSCIPEQLIEAVNKAASGGKFITSQLAEKLAATLDPGIHAELHENLSNRELQVFQMLASGKQVSQIGRDLSLSTKTVSTHRAKILKKMHMKSNAELMFYAIEKGLISKAQI